MLLRHGKWGAKILPVLMCVVWAVLLMPHQPMEAKNNCKLCNQLWDCEFDCSCDNTEFNIPWTVEKTCLRVCTQKVQKVNKHICKFTNNNNDNCPDETSKNCGRQLASENHVNILRVQSCASRYGTWVHCNQTNTAVSSPACD